MSLNYRLLLAAQAAGATATDLSTAIRQALILAGATPSTTDLNSLWASFLGTQGYSTGSLNDRLGAYLAAKGYSGSLADKMLQSATALDLFTNYTYATLNPADKGANLTLSNGNLTVASITTDWDSVRATLSKTSGKWYWEVQVGTQSGGAANVVLGVGNSSAQTASYFTIYDTGLGYLCSSGDSMTNNVASGYGTTVINGDYIGLALDADARTLNVARNNTYFGVLNIAFIGAIYPMAAVYNDQWIAIHNFGDSTMQYAPPSGYNAGLYE